MKSLVSKLFGVNTVRPMATMTCERVYCSASGTNDTLYEVFPDGRRVKRGCC